MEQGEVNQTNSKNHPQWIRKLSIENEILRFQFLKKDFLVKEVLLNAGYKTITSRFFKHDIPTEAETEYAINFIEDELMSKKELLNNQETLISTNNALVNAFHNNGLIENLYSRQIVEDLFSSYARVILAQRSSILNIEFTADNFAIILLLREIMHHLNFDSIIISGI